MEGTVFLEILRYLQREGWEAQAAALEEKMKARTAVWSKLAAVLLFAARQLRHPNE
jgi:hypothetical protein